VALSRVVESGPGGEDLAAGASQRLEALPDPRSPRGRIYPLACLIAIAVCAFTAAGNDRFTKQVVHGITSLHPARGTPASLLHLAGITEITRTLQRVTRDRTRALLLLPL
jgi:hypothetical protein